MGLEQQLNYKGAIARKIELLSPGGDVEAIKAAIVAGTNAVYCGLDTFNARNRASNLSFEELCGVLRLAHEYNCEVFSPVSCMYCFCCSYGC